MFRTVVLHIDPDTVLPLLYEYDAHDSCFRSVGFVRVGARMLPELKHPAPDTAAGRDDFLTTLLSELGIPVKRIRRIVLGAGYPNGVAEPPPPSTKGIRRKKRGRSHRSPGGEWLLSRVRGGDFWELTNTATKALCPISLTFSGPRYGMTWKDEVLLSQTVPVLEPSGSTNVHIVDSAAMTGATLVWRTGSTFSRRREWVVEL